MCCGSHNYFNVDDHDNNYSKVQREYMMNDFLISYEVAVRHILACLSVSESTFMDFKSL